MKNIFLILLLAILSISISGKNCNGQSSGCAKIRFVDKKEEHSKTYLGKLTKGDLESLKFELKNNFADPQINADDKNQTKEEGYINRVTAKKLTKKWKKNREKANSNLLGNYIITDEETLTAIKEKKLAEKEEKKLTKNTAGNKNNYLASNETKRPNSYISKNYRIKGKRIRNGQTFKKSAGYISLIVKYKVLEGNFVNTYISIVDDYLKEGSNYDLKYHGNGSIRKYYLEYNPAPGNLY